MKVKTFWSIVLKILGIYIVLGSISIFPQFFSSVYYIFQNDSSNDTIEILFFSFMILGLYVFILWLFVYQTSWLIDKLKLEKGFEEEQINLNIKESTILNIAIIIIGGLMLVESLPIFCKSIFQFFQQKSLFKDYPDTGWIIAYFLKAIIGYLLMTNSKYFVCKIQKQNSKTI